MTRKIVRLFVNILSADDKYSVLNRDNLTQLIQMQLCQKQHLEKKITLTADVFLILRTPKNIVKQISKKSTFRGPFEKQHVKGY